MYEANNRKLCSTVKTFKESKKKQFRIIRDQKLGQEGKDWLSKIFRIGWETKSRSQDWEENITSLADKKEMIQNMVILWSYTSYMIQQIAKRTQKQQEEN